MKIQVKKESLQTSLEALCKLKKLSDNEIYRFATVFTTRQDIVMDRFSPAGSVRAFLEGEVLSKGSMLLPVENVLPLIKSAPSGSKITLELDKFIKITMKVEGKRASSVKMPAISPTFTPLEFPEEPEENVIVNTEGVRKVAYLCDGGDFSFKHRGVFFDKKYIFGGTGNRLGVYETDEYIKDPKVLDPDAVSSYVIDKSIVSLSPGACWISNDITTVASRYLTSTVPKIEAINKSSGIKICVQRDSLTKAVKTAASITTKESKTARLVISENTGLLMLHGRGSGEFPFEVEGDKVDQQVYIPSLEEALRTFSGDVVLLDPDCLPTAYSLSDGPWKVILTRR